MTVRPAKAHISLGIRPVWSDSWLCAQWVAKDPSFLRADQSLRSVHIFHQAAHFVLFYPLPIKQGKIFFAVTTIEPVSMAIKDMNTMSSLSFPDWDLYVLDLTELSVLNDLSHGMKKNVSSGVSDQVRLKLACSATEASMRLKVLVTETKNIILSRQRTTKALIRLRGCAGWSAPLFLAYDVRHVFSWPG